MLYSKDKLEELRKRWETPQGKRLLKTIKNSRCYLSPILFRQKAKNFPGIDEKVVQNSVDLRGANLSGFDFRIPIQDTEDGYVEELAILSQIHFEGATLKHCIFADSKIHDCYFENADISHSEFKNASLNSCRLQEADCSGTNFHGAKLINCNFQDATITDMTADTTIVDQKTTFGKHLKSEKEENYHFASIEYKQIKSMYRHSSLHAEADLYHYKEMVAKRKLIPKNNPVRLANYIFGDLLCKYGTSFIRVLIASILVIFSCATLYTVYDGLYYYDLPIQEPSFANSLYFSIVTFTTLGYGDFHAISNMRFIAAAEAFLGATLMALFTVVVARTIIRD